MTIGTGYFSKAKSYAKDGWTLISIALKDAWFLPSDLKITSLKELAPTPEILKLKDNPEEYEKRFRAEVLSKIDWYALYSKLCMIARAENKEKVVFLCYESPEKFCHRHIVAKWIEDGLGKVVSEVSPKQQQNQSLFNSDV
jgi:uncharacterized protein YeaO (DUF488 family)